MNIKKFVDWFVAIVVIMSLIVVCLPSDDEGFIVIKVLLIVISLAMVGLVISSKVTDKRMEKQLGKETWEQIQANAEDILIEEERRQAIASQKMTEPWAVRFETSPCPHCGHYKVRPAKWDDKRLSVAFWGAASDKIGKAYICEHCKSMW